MTIYLLLWCLIFISSTTVVNVVVIAVDVVDVVVPLVDGRVHPPLLLPPLPHTCRSLSCVREGSANASICGYFFASARYGCLLVDRLKTANISNNLRDTRDSSVMLFVLL